MTEELFREDAYLKSCDAKIIAIGDDWIELDRTVFYPTGGGQPGDTGYLQDAGSGRWAVVDTVKSVTDGSIVRHLVATPPALDMVGSSVEARIDWERRYRLMRMHTCMHLLCAVIEGGVTGGSIRDGSARLDFDLPDTLLDKERITASLNELIAKDALVVSNWVTEAELDAGPDLVRTMSVKPPRGQGKVRLLSIEGIDLQPCGGTHVARTGEIGAVRVKKIEKKGKHNRRVNIVFDAA
jgi:misacylated tRNA(Ala) deacylase